MSRKEDLSTYFMMSRGNSKPLTTFLKIVEISLKDRVSEEELKGILTNLAEEFYRQD